MACSCCDFTDAAGQEFNAKRAAQQLRDYRRGRVGQTTRLLRDGLVMARLNAGALLDIGAGVGVLTFELLDRGVASAVAVEASSAYLAGAVAEASRRNRSAVISFRHGDFVRLASDVPDADVVTLDRVVCCYADYRLLLHNALPRARHALALSYPRDRWFVRFVVRVENALRGFRSNTFQTFVHPVDEMQRLIRESGFELVTRQETAAWSADIYSRRLEGATTT